MRTLTIIIDDNDSVCSQGYQVQYKLTTDVDYTDWTPDPITAPIVITGLDDDTNYNVRVRRLCCDGTISDWTLLDVNTTPNSPA